MHTHARCYSCSVSEGLFYRACSAHTEGLGQASWLHGACER